jgi:hypothetical protein
MSRFKKLNQFLDNLYKLQQNPNTDWEKVADGLFRTASWSDENGWESDLFWGLEMGAMNSLMGYTPLHSIIHEIYDMDIEEVTA